MKANKEIRLEVREAIEQANEINGNITVAELLDKYSLHQALRVLARCYELGGEQKTKHFCLKLAKQSLEIIY
ncbi:MAG: hypothetical protein ACYC5G_05270 [Candidatus Doudnabacteria bacterium]